MIDQQAKDVAATTEYKAPKLTDYGQMSELVQTSSTPSGSSDMGTFPNSYAS